MACETAANLVDFDDAVVASAFATEAEDEADPAAYTAVVVDPDVAVAADEPAADMKQKLVSAEVAHVVVP